MLVAAPATLPIPTPSPEAKPSQARQIEATWKNEFDFRPVTIRKRHAGIRSYEIEVSYPQIERARTRVSSSFNRWIKRHVTESVRKFERLERNAETRDRRNKLSAAKIAEGLKIWYTVYYSDSRLISLRLTHSVMALGQMHPIDYYETINYHLGSGRPLREMEIFKKGYAKAFSSFSRQHLKDIYDKDYLTDEWLRRGTTPRRDNFPSWNIVPDGILISFEDYQIGPHSFGQLELIVPYSELRRVVRRNEVTISFLLRK